MGLFLTLFFKKKEKKIKKPQLRFITLLQNELIRRTHSPTSEDLKSHNVSLFPSEVFFEVVFLVFGFLTSFTPAQIFLSRTIFDTLTHNTG